MNELTIDDYGKELEGKFINELTNKYLSAYPVSGAIFLHQSEHRACLWRLWSRTGIFKEYVMFIGLNPSTANQTKNDPTITRIAQFAKRHGYSGFFMTNLFTVISSSPAILNNGDVGDQETANMILEAVYSLCKDVVFAWGNFRIVVDHKRDKDLMEMFPDALCITKNKNGSPGHPLYKKGTIKFTKYKS